MATAADSARKNSVSEKESRAHYESRIPLTPTGLLMEGHFTSVRFSFAFSAMMSVMAIFRQTVAERSSLHSVWRSDAVSIYLLIMFSCAKLLR